MNLCLVDRLWGEKEGKTKNWDGKKLSMALSSSSAQISIDESEKRNVSRQKRNSFHDGNEKKLEEIVIGMWIRSGNKY